MIQRVQILTKDNCAYCVKAKQALDKVGLEYNEYDYETNTLAVEEFEHVYKTIDTLPQIVIDGALIGGYYDLVLHLIDYRDIYKDGTKEQN